MRYAGDADFTVDFNGFTFTSNTTNSAFVIVSDSSTDVTLKNGTITAGSSAYCTVITEGADGADDVVGVGALEGGPVLNGDFVVAVTAKKGNDVTNAGLGDIIEVDGEVVHGEAAEDRDGDATDEDGAAVGKGEREAIGIAGADGAHAHGAAGAIGVAVADGGAFGEVADLRQAGGHGEDGAQGDAEGPGGVEGSVEIDAAADEVEGGGAGGRGVVDGVGVGGVDPAEAMAEGFGGVEDDTEAAELLLGEGGGAFVGQGEVGEETFDL